MLTPNEISSILNDIPLFAGCSDATLSALSAVASERECEKGSVIYESGEQALEMFILINGLVSFQTATGTGHLHVEKLMKRHMIFGWAALVPEHPKRLGTAKCMDHSKLLAINGDAAMEILESDPRAGFLVMRRLCSMIASTFIEKS